MVTWAKGEHQAKVAIHFHPFKEIPYIMYALNEWGTAEEVREYAKHLNEAADLLDEWDRKAKQ